MTQAIDRKITLEEIELACVQAMDELKSLGQNSFHLSEPEKEILSIQLLCKEHFRKNCITTISVGNFFVFIQDVMSRKRTDSQATEHPAMEMRNASSMIGWIMKELPRF